MSKKNKKFNYKASIALFGLLSIFTPSIFSQFLLEGGSSLAILGNHEPIKPAISIGYSPNYFSAPVGITYTKVIGKKRTSIIAMNFYFDRSEEHTSELQSHS